MTELAVAYVSIVPETSKLAPGIKSALDGAQVHGDKAGVGLGSKMASGMGRAFSVAAKTTALAAGTVMAAALSQGFKRITAIDDARGKLAGLGHTAQGVAGIMDSALAAVKGTAFGLGDAATIAASAVAAGVKPGQDLTKYLSLTADAATIAGTSLGDMGAIINKVTTGGKAFTDDLNQLSDRGIPIFQWLQTEYGVSAEALSKMVKDGKVDAETFQKVIRENIGGAALESGKTLTGAWANTKAALGRLGAAFLTPFLDDGKGGLGKVTEFFDNITPKVQSFAQWAHDGLSGLASAFKTAGASIDGPASNFEKFGVKARQVFDGVKGVYSLLAHGTFKENTFGLKEDSGVVSFLKKVHDGLEQVFSSLRHPANGNIKKIFDGFKSAEGTANGLKSAGESAASTLSKLGSAAKDIGSSLVGLAGDTGTVAATSLRALGGVMGFFADHTGLATAALAGFAASVVIAQGVETAFHAARVAQVIMMPAQLLVQRQLTQALIAHTAALTANTGAQTSNIATTLRGRIAQVASAAAARLQAAATVQATSTLGAYAIAQRTAAASSGLLMGSFQRATAGAATFAGRIQGLATAGLGGLRSGVSRLTSALGGPFVLTLVAAAAAITSMRAASKRFDQDVEANKTTADRFAASMVTFRENLSEAFNANGGSVDSGVKTIVTDQIASIEAELKAATERIPSSFEQMSGTLGNLVTGNFKEAFSSDGLDLVVQGAKADVLRQALDKLGVTTKGLAAAAAGSNEEWAAQKARLDELGPAGAELVSQYQGIHDAVNRTREAAKSATPGLFGLKDAVKVLSDESASASDRLNAMQRALDILSGKPVALDDAMQSYNDTIRANAEATRDATGAAIEWDKTKGFGNDLANGNGSVNTATENGAKLRDALKDIKQKTLDVAQAGGELGPVFAKNDQVFRDLAASTGLSETALRGMAEQIGYIPDKIGILAELSGASEVEQQLVVIKGLLDKNKDGVEIPTSALTEDTIAALKGVDGVKVDVTKPGIIKVTAETQAALDKFQELINTKLPDKTQTVRIETIDPTGFITGNPGTISAPNHFPTRPNADGGIHDLPAQATIKRGQGQGVFQWAEGETGGEAFIPLASSKRGRSTSILADVAQRFGFRLEKFANGGVTDGIAAALSYGRSVSGSKYVWGGTGPSNFDCSGFVGWLQQIAMGIVGSTKRLYSTMSLLGGSTAGLVSGLGPSGTRFRVGVSNEHMAATIDGHRAESGGSHGNAMIDGAAVGAEDGQFPNKFHLPNNLIAGMVSASRSRNKTKTWTAEDDTQLESLQTSVTQAEEARDKVYANDKKSEADRRQADLRVEKAQQAVLKKQGEKDSASSDDGITPQAPALERAYSDSEISRIDKQKAVEDAEQSRNETYNNPDATDLDRAKADAQLSKAQRELNTADDSGSGGSKDFSVKGWAKGYATKFVSAIFDGLFEQVPSEISNSRWLTTDFNSLTQNRDGGGTSLEDALKNVSPDADLSKQLGYTPDGGAIPDWIAELQKNAPKVFDSGGWLMPGETGINLSNSPEPIFNSSKQLRQFAGNLEPAAGGVSLDDLKKVLSDRPNVTFQVSDIDTAMRKWQTEQRRQSISFSRR